MRSPDSRCAAAPGSPLCPPARACSPATSTGSTPLTDPRERELELGKVQNLRIAAAAVDGLVLEPGEIFSFWRGRRPAEPGQGLCRSAASFARAA